MGETRCWPAYLVQFGMKSEHRNRDVQMVRRSEERSFTREMRQVCWPD